MDLTREDLRDLRDDMMAHLTAMGNQMSAGFAGTHERLDALNGQTREHAKKIAVLQSQTDDLRADKGWRASLVNGGLVAAIGITLEYISHKWWR